MSSSVLATPLSPQTSSGPVEGFLGQAPDSPAGPLSGEVQLRIPPGIRLPRALQTLRFSVRQIELMFRARRQLGEAFRFRGMIADETIVITSHPDHVRSLFTADPELVPSLTGESPLRPIVGPYSVLTLLGSEHMRQRKLLLPSFHGEAIERYTAMIAGAAEREIDRWPLREPFPLAPAMQAITLDVIMSGIFGVEGRPRRGTPEHDLREEIRGMVRLTTHPIAPLIELLNINRTEPVGPVRRLIAALDRHMYATIAARRRAEDTAERTDILSLLLAARDEEGQPMSDQELRDELLTLVLAGHETTANSLAWTFERLLRTPRAYERLREEVRGGGEDPAAEYVQATLHEAMRSRPVIPIIGRRVQAPWRLGQWRLPAGSSVLVSILLLHHRHDLYPDPFSFRPERFLGVKPGTYTWIPFGGGIRRCLGATLAMAEQRTVLRAIARRTDMSAPDLQPEHARHRNVTMIPAKGARVLVRERRAA
jgi:cytochrome P450 family 135